MSFTGKSSATEHFDCAVIGAWHLAIVSAACLADAGHRVLLVNPDGEAAWPDFPKCPVVEPGLDAMIAAARQAGRLHYVNGLTVDVEKPAWQSRYLWLAVDTPVNDRDEADTTPLEQLAHIASVCHRNTQAFIISSQIPIGFCASIQARTGLTPVYVPENLRLGKGIATFKEADRTVIGAPTAALGEQIAEFLKGFKTEFMLCNLETAEMVKHATNAFLATSISFANEMAKIGELYGVDNHAVARALKMDKRIGPMAYVAPGLGFAGGTLPRDLRTIQSIGTRFGVRTPLVDAVLDINESTTAALADIILQRIQGLRQASVAVLGYTYKADTDTLRRSMTIDLARLLRQKVGADFKLRIDGFDPMMNDRDLSELDGLIEHYDQWERLPKDPDVVISMTARPAFRELSWSTLIGVDSKPGKTMVIDTQNILNAPAVLKAGAAFKPLWAPVMTTSNTQTV